MDSPAKVPLLESFIHAGPLYTTFNATMWVFVHPLSFFNAFTPRVSYEVNKVILTFKSMDKIVWCDHSYETSSAVLSHGTIYIISKGFVIQKQVKMKK